MAFILAEQRDVDATAAFLNHRCPHDAWLQHLVVQEVGRGDRMADRSLALSVELLGAYHDLRLTFTYGRVHRYSVEAIECEGHGDWRYDEFRVSPDGQERRR